MRRGGKEWGFVTITIDVETLTEAFDQQGEPETLEIIWNRHHWLLFQQKKDLQKCYKCSLDFRDTKTDREKSKFWKFSWWFSFLSHNLSPFFTATKKQNEF